MKCPLEHIFLLSPSRSQIVRASAARHRRDVTMSVLLLSIVMVFILCNTARVACNLYEAYQVHSEMYTCYSCINTKQLFFHDFQILLCNIFL